MKLLFVHGIAQENRSSNELKAEWTSSLNDGFRKAGVDPPPFDIIVPFFGDELARLATDYQSRSATPDQAAFLAEAANQIGVGGPSITPTDDSYLGVYNIIPGQDNPRGGEAGAALPKPLRSALSSLDQAMPGITSWTLRKFLNTVYVYITDGDVRNTIDGIILNEADIVDGEPALLVGHSLGSVVAYNLLNKRPNISWRGFVTLGSPLGIRAITDRLPSNTPRIPRLKNSWADHSSSTWLNAFDARDIVALNQLVPPFWEPKNLIDNWAHLDNFTPNRHGIRGYLNDPRVAAAIAATAVK
ncbi:hypothetical protein [Tardiphaga sp. 367_B4_N1_1]|uniref:hypothetical protein n=1 Tax=Tardiphaga sp. 367_B4_N1_1 TaxID=3240777 RepID=UPI003F23AF35